MGWHYRKTPINISHNNWQQIVFEPSVQTAILQKFESTRTTVYKAELTGFGYLWRRPFSHTALAEKCRSHRAVVYNTVRSTKQHRLTGTLEQNPWEIKSHSDGQGIYRFLQKCEVALPSHSTELSNTTTQIGVGVIIFAQCVSVRTNRHAPNIIWQ